MAANFDVRCFSRYLDNIVEQIVAARAIEPDLLEPVQKVDQAIEQAVVPFGGLTRASGNLTTLEVKYHARNADDHHAHGKGQKRQIRDVDSDEEDENNPLACKRHHVRRLGERRGLLGDGRNYCGAANLVERQQFRVPHLVHEPHPQFVDDGFDLDGCGNQNVVLGLDEQE